MFTDLHLYVGVDCWSYHGQLSSIFGAVTFTTLLCYHSLQHYRAFRFYFSKEDSGMTTCHRPCYAHDASAGAVATSDRVEDADTTGRR